MARFGVETSGDGRFTVRATARGDPIFSQFIAVALDNHPFAVRAIGVLVFAVDHVAGINVSQADIAGKVRGLNQKRCRRRAAIG